MLNRFCILSSDWQTLLHTSGYTHDIFPVFIVQPDAASLHALFKLVYSYNNHSLTQSHFSICFDLSNAASSEDSITGLLESGLICNLVFHSSFYVLQNVPQLFYRNSTAADRLKDTFLEAVCNQLTEHSYRKVEFKSLESALSIDLRNFLTKDDGRLQFGETRSYANSLEQGLYNQYLAVEHDIESVLLFTQEVERAEAEFSNRYPVQHKHLVELVKYSRENQLLKWQEEYHLAEIDNYKTYLHLLLSNDEANIINQFYYHEYEILPLWFKRIGHLVKVVTGKRSLRSLYDKKVKKHKP